MRRLLPPVPPGSPPVSPTVWPRQGETRVIGPHVVVAVVTLPTPPPPADPTHCPPLLVQRIEYIRLFEAGRCPPNPPVGLERQRAVRLYSDAVREDETSPAWEPSGWLRRR